MLQIKRKEEYEKYSVLLEDGNLTVALDVPVLLQILNGPSMRLRYETWEESIGSVYRYSPGGGSSGKSVPDHGYMACVRFPMAAGPEGGVYPLPWEGGDPSDVGFPVQGPGGGVAG